MIYFPAAQELCRKYGTLFIADEVQTALGRTGKWFGFQHWNLDPDIVTMAKALSGGYVPCAAIVMRRPIYQGIFSRLDRCVAHSTTFGRNQSRHGFADSPAFMSPKTSTSLKMPPSEENS